MAAAAAAARRARGLRDGRLQLPADAGAGAGARQLIADGRIGTVRQVRASYLQDWLADEAAPMTWRLRKETAGSGALGDLGVARRRPGALPARPGHRRGDGPARDLRAVAGGRRRARGRDRRRRRLGDAAAPPAARWPASRSAGWRPGARTRSRSRSTAAPGRSASTWSGSTSCEVCLDGVAGLHPDAGDRAVRTPTLDAWWPPGHILGWDHTFTNQAADFLDRDRRRRAAAPSFADGLAVQRVLAAIEESAASSGALITLAGGLTTHGRRDAVHPLHRPVGRPDARGGRRAGGRLGLRRPRDRRVGRAPRRLALGRRRLHRRAPRDPRPARARAVGDLQPPDRPGRLRRPDRLPARGDRAAAGVGRRRPRGRAPAGGRGDEADRAARAEARGQDRRGLHRLLDLAVRRHVPAASAPSGSRRATRTSPTGGTRSSTCSTSAACASPTRCTPPRSPTTTGRRCARSRRSGAVRRSG